MPNTLRVPKYRRHKTTGQAVVALNGKDHYLGKWNTESRKAEYRRLIGEWLAGGGRLPASSDLTVNELAMSYWRFAKSYYRAEPGRSRGAAERVRVALRALREAYGHCLAGEFGPLALQSVQRRLADSGKSRRW